MWVFPHEWLTDENPGVATSGVFYSFCYGGLDHRLITDYLSPSNHLQTRWLITPATTAITRDVIASTWTPPFRTSLGGGNGKSIPQIYRLFLSFFLQSFLLNLFNSDSWGGDQSGYTMEEGPGDSPEHMVSIKNGIIHMITNLMPWTAESIGLLLMEKSDMHNSWRIICIIRFL